MKETTELLSAVFATINTAKIAAADGKLNLEDFSLLLPLIFDWQKAIQNLTFAQEARNATPQAIDIAFDTASQKLTAWDNYQKFALTQLLKGLYSGYWLAVRHGAAQAIAELEAAGK